MKQGCFCYYSRYWGTHKIADAIGTATRPIQKIYCNCQVFNGGYRIRPYGIYDKYSELK